MSLSWVAVVLTVTGLVVWFEGSRQEMGFLVFLVGGSMWLLSQEIGTVKKNLKNHIEDKKSDKN
jgi:hypothetical protein